MALPGPRIRHKHFDPGSLAAGGEVAKASTGVELDAEDPRALRILAAKGTIRNSQIGADGHGGLQLFLKFSDEPDMDPGPRALVSSWSFGGDGTGDDYFAINVQEFARDFLAGSLWVGKYWALDVVVSGTWTAFTPELRVLYEVVPVDFHTALFLHEMVDSAVDDSEDWWNP